MGQKNSKLPDSADQNPQSPTPASSSNAVPGRQSGSQEEHGAEEEEFGNGFKPKESKLDALSRIARASTFGAARGLLSVLDAVADAVENLSSISTSSSESSRSESTSISSTDFTDSILPRSLFEPSEEDFDCSKPSCPNSHLSEDNIYLCRKCDSFRLFCGPHVADHMDHTDQVLTLLKAIIDSDIEELKEQIEGFAESYPIIRRECDKIELFEALVKEELEVLSNRRWPKTEEVSKLNQIIAEFDRLEVDSRLIRRQIEDRQKIYEDLIIGIKEITAVGAVA